MERGEALVLVAHDAVVPRVLVDGDDLVAVFHEVEEGSLH